MTLNQSVTLTTFGETQKPTSDAEGGLVSAGQNNERGEHPHVWKWTHPTTATHLPAALAAEGAEAEAVAAAAARAAALYIIALLSKKTQSTPDAGYPLQQASSGWSRSFPSLAPALLDKHSHDRAVWQPLFASL